MPSFNQNLIKFEHDEFLLEYTVTDASTTLGSSNYAAWWGLSNTSTAAGELLISGHTISGISTYNKSQATSDCSAGSATGLNPGNNNGIPVSVFDYTITVSLAYTVFEGVNNGDYYHELVLMDKVGTTAYQCRSQVVATGILTVNQSLFTNYSYR